MNAILKIERYPEHMWDEQRYGPMQAWIKKYGRDWARRTLPKKAPYQEWLRGVLQTLPPEQNVFEINNEPWNKLAPEDFAAFSQWVVEVVKDIRPNAIIGPNLMGSTSEYKYDAAVIRAGGMKGMNMVALHPYAGSEDRAWLRRYREWLNETLGRDIMITVTEYGSHSTPEGPHRRSEAEQARRVVRQSLALYAEDVAIIMPHTMGQREHNSTYHEHWFGLYRLAHQPKPALLGLTTCARMVDGGEYLGDLWFGPGIGAMLFKKDGTHRLALFTKKGTKEILFDPGMETVTVVTMMGTETVLETAGGPLTLTVGEDVSYVVGVSPELAARASRTLNPKRWPAPEAAPRGTRSMNKVETPPVIDGSLDEWKDMTALSMINPKVAGGDASGVSHIGWDEAYFYIAVDMRDNELLNEQARPKLYRGDSVELFLSTEPRETNPGYGPHDYQFFVTPTSREGHPIVALITERASVTLENVDDAKLEARRTAKGWIVELALPWTVFPEFTPNKGEKLAFEIRVNDQDSSHQRFKIDSEDLALAVKPHEPTSWSYLLLE